MIANCCSDIVILELANPTFLFLICGVHVKNKDALITMYIVECDSSIYITIDSILQ